MAFESYGQAQPKSPHELHPFFTAEFKKEEEIDAVYKKEIDALCEELYELTQYVGDAVPQKPKKITQSYFNAPAQLVTACLNFLSALKPVQRGWNRLQKAHFVESHSNLCLWKDNTTEGRLELCLSYSTDLHRSILDLLCDIGKTVLKISGTASTPLSQDSDEHFHVNTLKQELRGTIRSGLDALADLDLDLDTLKQSSDSDSSKSEDETESEGDSEGDSISDADRINDLLRSLLRLTRVLMGTCPALEQTLQHISKHAVAIKAEPSELQTSEIAKNYDQKVNEDSPAGGLSSMKRLGELASEHNDQTRSVKDTLGGKREQRQESQSLELYSASIFDDIAPDPYLATDIAGKEGPLTPQRQLVPLTIATPGMKQVRARKRPRGGCIACRVRKVNCDENKPACSQCISAGRKCDGYEQLAPKTKPAATSDLLSSSSQPVSLQNSVPIGGTTEEKRIFHYFRVSTVSALSGGCNSGFWQSVLRAGIQEPVVLSAIVSLGTLHEYYRARSGRYDKNLIQEPDYQVALKLYGRSLRQLNERIADHKSDPSRSFYTILISILLTCFEVLRRNNSVAIMHYRAGFRELMRLISLQQHQTDPKALAQLISREELDAMLRVFNRYNIQAYTFTIRDGIEPLEIELTSTPPETLNLESARRHLYNLSVAAHQLMSSKTRMFRYWSTADCPSEWQVDVKKALGTFQSWHHALENFFNKSSSEFELSPMNAKVLLGLRLSLRIAIIGLETSIDSGPETTFDQFTDEFESMISSVEKLTQSLKLVNADPLDKESISFTMELGLVYPLFFITSKCRGSRLRRRAILQLRRVGKEGMWEGPIMAVIAKRMMQIEERGLERGSRVPESNRIHKLKFKVDYSDRCVYIEATLAKDETWKRWEVIRESIPF